MSILQNMSIKHKLISIIMATCIGALLLASIVQLLAERRGYREETVRSVSCYAKMVGDNCSAALAFKDAKDAQGMLKSLHAEPLIVFACVYTKEGKVLAHYQRPDVTDKFSPPVHRAESYGFDNNYFKLFKEIKDNDEIIGTVYIQFDLRKMKAMLWLKAGTIALVVLACSLLTYLVSSRLQRIISVPILNLAQVAKGVSEKKDYSVRALEKSNDEVGYLTQVFNTMLEQIQQRDSATVEAKGQLETRVRERTAELTIANERLTKQITERKQTEERLRETRDYLKNLIDYANAPIIVWDAKLKATRFNRAFERLTGHTADEVIGQDMDMLFPQASRKESLNKIERTLSGKYWESVDIPILCKNGQTRLVLWNSANIYAEDGTTLLATIAQGQDITERKQAEESLKKSENKYRILLENLPQRIFLKDRNSIYVSCNENFARDLGIRAEEFKGKTDYDFFPKELAEKYRGDDKRIMEAGTTEDVEEKYIRNGQEIIVQTVKTPVKDEHDNVVGVLGIFWDITDLKHAQEAIEKLSKFASENPNPVLRVQKDGKILYSNNVALPVLAKWKTKVGGAVPAKWRRLINKAFESEKAISNEEEVNEKIFSFVLAPIADSDYANLYARDITKRKQAEVKLKQTAEEWVTTFDSITDMVSIHDKDFKIVRANKSFAEAFNVKPGDIIGKTCYELIHGTKEPPPFCPHKRTLDTGKPNRKEFFEPRLGIYIEASTSPLFDENGQIIASVHIAKDITERKQAEAELKIVQKKLIDTAHRAGMSEVAADVLHNVGNVLNSINVSTTVIKEKVTSSELANLEKVASIINEHTDDLGTFLTEDPQGKYIPVYLTEVSKRLTDEQTDIIDKLKVLTENVQHIKDIVSMQQDYAKVSGVEVQTSLSKLAEDAIQINSVGLERHGTRLIREFEELGDVEIDKQKVLQILVNLINNAKYALSGSNREEKLLTIRIYKHNEARFRIEVADNGVGISEDNLTKIFRYGFTTKKDGLGFGLHSSALIAKEMGGTLTIYSDGLGQGATFTLELPFKPVEVMR